MDSELHAFTNRIHKLLLENPSSDVGSVAFVERSATGPVDSSELEENVH
jgi:hypothetical protein